MQYWIVEEVNKCKRHLKEHLRYRQDQVEDVLGPFDGPGHMCEDCLDEEYEADSYSVPPMQRPNLS